MRAKGPEPERKPQSLNCQAYGCPLVGSNNTGGEGWFCLYHNTVFDPKSKDEITRRVKQAMPMLEYIDKVRLVLVDDEMHIYPRNPIFNKVVGENSWQYVHRLQTYVKNFVKKGISMEGQAKEKRGIKKAADVATKIQKDRKPL